MTRSLMSPITLICVMNGRLVIHHAGLGLPSAPGPTVAERFKRFAVSLPRRRQVASQTRRSKSKFSARGACSILMLTNSSSNLHIIGIWAGRYYEYTFILTHWPIQVAQVPCWRVELRGQQHLFSRDFFCTVSEYYMSTLTAYMCL